MRKQFIAKMLVLAMVLAMVPVTVIAASATSNSGYYSVAVDTTTTVSAADINVEDGEAVITAKVVGQTATVSLPEEAVAALAEQATGDELVLKIDAPGATKVEVSLPAKALTAFGEKTSAALTVELGEVATISIPNDALASVFGTSGSAKISAQASGTTIGFTLQVSGKSLANIKGLQVTF